jgi:HD-GYP domain-containing protein (c-di-GMP phosphodiesterase class II)
MSGLGSVIPPHQCDECSGYARSIADSQTEITGVALEEVVAALSLVTDLAMGLPFETGLAVCRVAVALAEEAGLDDAGRARVYHVALLRHVGCTAENSGFAEIVGDDIAFRAGSARLDATSPRALGGYMLGHLFRTRGLVGTAAKLASMAAQRDRFQEGVLAVCEVGELLARHLGLGEDVQRDLLLVSERWDGKSFLKRAHGEEVPVGVRVVQVAECASVYDALGGPEAAAAVVRERAGGAFDPRLAELFASRARALLTPPEGSLWDAVVERAPARGARLSGEPLDAALAAMAEFADLKSPYTVGHSTGVAALAEGAAQAAAMSEADAALLRRAALVHDVGRVAVPSPIWEKAGALSPDEWERVRLHPYHGERVLARSPGLARLAAIASRHHERCDGSGYHRGLDRGALSPAARILAAADACHAMGEERPHRAALAPDAVAAELNRGVKAGSLDADAVECVLVAAGRRPRRRRPQVAGLTARELEVLQLIARGRSTKQIAADLTITPKTADSHIQHIYSKLGVSTRAAATVFAMHHGLT